jgi:DNA-binding transcriptional LysR family regulator
MTLKQLEAFYWAATAQNFAVAAGRLSISVSSLSKRISEFESQLNAELFDRSARSVSLTPLGEELLPHAQALLKSADQFLIRATSGLALSGRCRLGVGELTAITWLPVMIEAIQARHPNLWVEPTIDVGQQLEKGLEEGVLDFAIISGPSTRAFLSSTVIGYADFEWVTAFDDANAKTMQPTDLIETTLISLPQGAGTSRILNEWVTAEHVTIGRQLTCQNMGAIAGLICQGLGVGFLPSAWACALIQRGAMKRLDNFPKLDRLPYGFHWRRDDSRLMVEQIRVIARESINFGAPATLM